MVMFIKVSWGFKDSLLPLRSTMNPFLKYPFGSGYQGIMGPHWRYLSEAFLYGRV